MQTGPTSFEFTRARIEAATCPAGKSQALFWDTKQPGLGLRVTPGGKSSFIFEGRLGHQTIRMTIGPASMPIRVPKDRKGNPTGPGADGEALRLLALVKAGTDPRAEKSKKDREAAKAAAQAAGKKLAERGAFNDMGSVFNGAITQRNTDRGFSDSSEARTTVSGRRFRV